MTLQRALLAVILLALLAGLIPAGASLHRRLERELIARARAELAVAPRVLADRDAAIAAAMMMHAKEVASAPALAAAVARRDRAVAERLVADAAESLGDADGILVLRSGEVWRGPPIGRALLEATRRGEMPVVTITDSDRLTTVAVAPLRADGDWFGAAGVVRPVDTATATALAAVTRSDVVLAIDTRVVAATLPDTLARAIAAGSAEASPFRVGSRRFLVERARLGDGGTVLFVRDLDQELAVLPRLRRVTILSAVFALALSLLLGAMLVTRLTRSVRSLADAADRMTAGDFGTPLRSFTIGELQRVAGAFDTMRRTLASRLRDLESANVALAAHSARLGVLQSELMQRDRLAATSHLVAQLAHEIRNPVANLRNCLEVLRKRLDHDERGREFADLAIDELLRMHELAEQLLDVNRPRDPAVRHCDAAEVAREVAALESMGDAGSVPGITITGAETARARIAPDTLKQVLTNVVRNAREAIATQDRPGAIQIDVTRVDTTVVITVRDDGPGIAPAVLDRIFDPFVSTKNAVHSVGLGMYVAEGLVRAAGGRITAANNEGAPGARVRIELHAADVATREPETRRGAERSSAGVIR